MATLFSGYLPAPYYPTATGTGGFEALLVVGAILAVAVAVTVALVLLNRPAAQPKAREMPIELPRAA